jgi:hypothetical protein
MKTRIITATLIVLFAFVVFSGSANNRVSNISTASCHENLCGLKSQEMLDTQVSYDATILNEWVATREIWEQESQEMSSENVMIESTSLEEWISGRENWEQIGEDTVMENPYAGSLILDAWITGNETWEQK